MQFHQSAPDFPIPSLCRASVKPHQADPAQQELTDGRLQVEAELKETLAKREGSARKFKQLVDSHAPPS
jgi:hypothetical protein